MAINKRFLCCVPLFIMLFNAGCMSIEYRRSGGAVGWGDVQPGPYPGVRWYGNVVKATASCCYNQATVMVIGLSPFWVTDGVLCIGLDTLLLPYDFFQTGKTVACGWNENQSIYSVIRCDKSGKQHGRADFQYNTEHGCVFAYVYYDKGLLVGKAHAEGKGVATDGEYKNNEFWNGSFFIPNTDAQQSCRIDQYKNGEMIDSSILKMRLRGNNLR